MKTYKSFPDLGEAFKSLVSKTFIRYKGNLLETTIDGYKMGGKHYKTLEDIDIELQRQYNTWNEQIKTQNNG